MIYYPVPAPRHRHNLQGAIPSQAEPWDKMSDPFSIGTAIAERASLGGFWVCAIGIFGVLRSGDSNMEGLAHFETFSALIG